MGAGVDHQTVTVRSDGYRLIRHQQKRWSNYSKVFGRTIHRYREWVEVTWEAQTPDGRRIAFPDLRREAVAAIEAHKRGEIGPR